MTDELKQWEYDRAYDKGQADIVEKVKEEIKYELCMKVHEKDSCIPCLNQTTSCSYTGLRIYEINNIINHVIDKHLSEVSE